MCLGSGEQDIGQDSDVEQGIEEESTEPGSTPAAGDVYSLINTHILVNQREGGIGNSSPGELHTHAHAHARV